MRPYAKCVRKQLVICIIAVLSLSAWTLASTDFVVKPGRPAGPISMTVGPDKNLWFAELYGEKIGNTTTSGVVTEFKISGAQSLVGIASGPDGNIWFTDQFTGKIGHVNTSGKQLKQFSLPGGSFPQGMTVGPDGNLWFVDQKQNGKFTIGKITTAGKVTEYATNVNAGSFQDSLYYAQIVLGPDGNLWFTNWQAGGAGTNLVGRITTQGKVTTFSTLDTPVSICAGPDGNLWVTEFSHVAQVTTSGVETEYAITGSGFDGITTGPDGNIWFTELGKLGYVTPQGTVTEFKRSEFAAFSYLSGITSAPDGALWFLGNQTSNIGRITTSGQLTNTYALNAGSVPWWDTPGPDGAVWFTELTGNQIGRIGTDGKVTSFPILTQNSAAAGIVTGSDGNLWFTEQKPNQVAKITPSGTVTEYPVTGYGLWGITAGPDGNLWFTEWYANNIAKITTSGTITEYALPTQSSSPQYVTPGPDGKMWFTESSANQVGSINTDGSNIVEYSLGSGKVPGPIVTGSDGNLWFIENTLTGAVGSISTSGALQEYSVPIQGYPQGITAGPDGALWFETYYPNVVERITTGGVFSEVPITVENAQANQSAVGKDGKLWVVDGSGGAISRLSAIGGTGNSIKATHGKPFKGTVASFVDGTPTATQANFTATINWGDGTKASGTVSGSTGGPFKVSGTHTYKKAGAFKLLASLHDKVDNSDYQASLGKATVK